jgi:hypothetical protein
MRGYSNLLAVLMIFLVTGCEHSGGLSEFFRPAPVEPLADVIRTSIPIGHCAMVAMADQAGFNIPYDKITAGNGISVIRLEPGMDFPLGYLNTSCREIIILRLPADDDFAILSIFFIYTEHGSSKEEILEIHTIPAMIDEGNVKAVFASQDIYVRDSVEINLQMGPADIWIEIDRLEDPPPETTEAAIEQNAWIIEIYPSGTWDAFTDDSYTITGGAQDVSVLTGTPGSETRIIQMAMIDTKMHPACELAPREGFALLREISLETGLDDSMQDLVLGTVFYHFNPSCTGKVEISLATGSFLTSTGKKINLRLLE